MHPYHKFRKGTYAFTSTTSASSLVPWEKNMHGHWIFFFLSWSNACTLANNRVDYICAPLSSIDIAFAVLAYFVVYHDIGLCGA